MQRLLLVIDDFSELRTLETIFRRLGLDVLTVGKDLLVNDALLGFQPDIVIASHRGRNVDGLKLALRLRKLTPPPKTAILHSKGLVPELGAHHRQAIDAFIETPIKERNVIGIVGQLAGVDVQSLIEKYEKIAGAKLSKKEDLVHVSHQGSADDENEDFDPVKTPGSSPRLRTVRSEKYDRFLGEHNDKVDGVVSQDALRKAMSKLAEVTSSDKVEKAKVADIDQERQAFAKALFNPDKKTK
jgi:CheY-like chemotaxis protein